MARIKRTKDRPFPWRCGSCDAKEVYRTPTRYKSTIKYEGRPYDIEIPYLEVPKCRSCGEVVFDNHAGHQINRALRRQLGLLQPDQIRAGRTELGLSQKEFAARLGVAEESVSRWETGALIQSRVVDRQIRLFFEFPAVRESLGKLQRGDSFGETVKSPASPGDVGTVTAPLESLQATIEHRLRKELEEYRDVIRRTMTEVRRRDLPFGCRDWREFWSDYESLFDATATYAILAPQEEVQCAARLFSSWARRAVPLERKRWFAAYLGPQSPITAPISERLARLTQDLENVRDSDAAALLDLFARLLEMWAKRASRDDQHSVAGLLE